MKRYFENWWHGTYTDVETDQYGNLPPGAELLKRHWTSKLAHWFVLFWLKEWKWCFTFAFATAGLILAAMRI